MFLVPRRGQRLKDLREDGSMILISELVFRTDVTLFGTDHGYIAVL